MLCTHRAAVDLTEHVIQKPLENTHLCMRHVLAYTINHHHSCSHNCPRYFCICILDTGRPACLCIHPHLGNSQKKTFEECLIIYFVSQTTENDMLLVIYKEASALISQMEKYQCEINKMHGDL